MTTTALNPDTVTFAPGDRVRVTDIDGLVQNATLYVGALGTVEIPANSPRAYVYVRLDGSSRTGPSGLLSYRLEHVGNHAPPTAAEVLDHLSSALCRLQVDLAMELLQPLGSLDTLAIRAQASGLDAALHLIENLDVH